jgi:hypothetical protein
MVCDFCPGGEQAPPNSRKKTASTGKKQLGSKETGGKCSTCNTIFSTAQDLYDHLDECVLKSLEQEEPSEAHNARHLANVAQDKDVKDTLEKYNLPSETMNEQQDEDEEDEAASDDADGSARPTRSGKGTKSLPSKSH